MEVSNMKNGLVRTLSTSILGFSSSFVDILKLDSIQLQFFLIINELGGLPPPPHHQHNSKFQANGETFLCVKKYLYWLYKHNRNLISSSNVSRRVLDFTDFLCIYILNFYHYHESAGTSLFLIQLIRGTPCTFLE